MWRKTYNISTKVADKVGSPGFQRVSFRLTTKSQFVLVQYIGDESIYVPRPHGNQKSTAVRNFASTMPSVLSKIKEQSAYKKPQEVYRSMVLENKVHGKYQGVLNPRNAEQVRNVQRQVNKTKKLTHDEIYNTLQLAFHLDDYVHQLTIYPDLQCFVANKELLMELNKNLQVKSNEVPLLSYDTTFLIGDFYVSVLVFKHVWFECSPTIPVAFYIHDRKSEEIHHDFWRKICKLVPNLNRETTVVVTDREKAVVNAIKKTVPNATLVHCWNHIFSDAMHWIRQHGGKGDDQTVYISHLRELLHASSEEEYEEILAKLSEIWSESFLEYYKSKLHQDIVQHSSKWVLEQHQIYDPYSGVTNNMSESMNAVIKRLMEWKQAPLDATVLAFNYLQKFYVHEIMRGLCNVGNYCLKQILIGASADKGDVIFPTEMCAPEKIIDLVRGKLAEETTHSVEDDKDSKLIYR